VISRDNALIYLDAVMNYKVTNPKTMMYNTQNLPMMISKILQAQIRNIAGTLDVDQIIEDTAAMDRVAGEVASATTRWGIHVEFVKIQRVEAGELAAVLAKKKNADLQNQEIFIHARAHKQTEIIQSEGRRDQAIKEAEGEAQQIISRARGEAKAIVNLATSEAASIREISRAVRRSGTEDPSKYLLALKYLEALEMIVTQPCQFNFLPQETSFVQVAKDLVGSSVLLGNGRMDV